MTRTKTKFENNWLAKSLENLEKDYWGDVPEGSTYLVTTCYTLRKKQLKEFDQEDLRIMIGQNIGLKYLIPLALDTLEKNILAEGNLHEGDLLESVLTSNPDYWKEEIDAWNIMCVFFRNNKLKIEEATARRKILKAFSEFEKIN